MPPEEIDDAMDCPTCEKSGTVSRKRWDDLYGKDCNDNFLRDALLALQSHDPAYEIRIWSDGSHYDHGYEPAITIMRHQKIIYSDWGIYLPDLIKKAAEFMVKHKEDICPPKK